MKNMEAKMVTVGISWIELVPSIQCLTTFLSKSYIPMGSAGGDLLSLLRSYLDDRRIKIRVNGTCSKASTPYFINSGVPQGSIIGPLLFLLYINGISDVHYICTPTIVPCFSPLLSTEECNKTYPK
jgi:hypothetical protein